MRGFCLSGNFAMKAEKNVVFFSEDFAAIVTEKGGDELYKCSFVTSFCHNNHLLANKHLFISLYPARRSLDSLEMGIWITTRWSKGKWKLDGRSIPQELYGITSFVFMIALSTLCHKPDLYLLWMLAFILSSSTLYREWSAQGLSPRRDQWHLCKDLTLIFLSRQHQSNSHVRSILWVDFASIAMKVSSKTQKVTLVCGITLPYDRM